jgi:hypothetical protein
MALEYSEDIDAQHVFLCASDAAYGDDSLTRRSTEGFLFKLFGGPVDWRSTKQKTVTTSSTEAEFLALSHAAKELYGWQRFFHHLNFSTGHRSTIFCDNQQTIRLLIKDTPRLETRLRHIDIQQHWLRQEVQEKRLHVEWLPTAQMPADGLTKALTRQKHDAFVKHLGLVDIKGLITSGSSTSG